MDDDDIVLNLSYDAPLSASKRKSVGRSTPKERRDRRAQVHGSARLKRKAGPQTEQGEATGDVSTDPARPSKRPRTEVDDTPHVTSTAKGPGRPTQIISSLFSYNPAIPAPDHASSPSRPGKPSNAPLRDSSSFAGLGLHPLLTSHLQAKLGIDKPTSIQRAALSALVHPYTNGSLHSSSESLRDAFIQSQTGSGKTLSYLLPIIQDLLPLSSLSYIDRSIGTLAVILAPTRELAKQICDVLEQLLSMRLHGDDDDGDNDDEETTSPRFTRWLVSGLLTGGATRTHEKARLRKGVPILVSTPGRLLDHLQNTSSFNVGKCRWLVLDEADRLMDLGFEETITGILRALEGRRKLASQAADSGPTLDVGGWDWSIPRRNILCSATMREDVQKLAGVALQNPIVIKGLSNDEGEQNTALLYKQDPNKFTPPSQLLQKYVVVPLKLRLVCLIALLRTLLAGPGDNGSKRSSQKDRKRVIVFMSCTDSVDLIWTLLGGAAMGGVSEGDDEEDNPHEREEAEEGSPKTNAQRTDPHSISDVRKHSALLPNTSLFRLHGSLPLQTRLASLKVFASESSDKRPDSTKADDCSVLFCTSVASRGLDLPRVQAVIQYDLPTEGGATEYIHRVGRTARVGRGGEAWAFISPSETGWVRWVEEKMTGETDGPTESRLRSIALAEVLKSGFGGSKPEYEARATQVQLTFERWALSKTENAALARKAFASHVRAYATHPSDEKHLFHIRNLHLGHLAKSFALRDAPSNMGANVRHNMKGKSGKSAGKQDKLSKGASDRMRNAIKRQTGAGAVADFQIADSVLLEDSV